ncbi:ATP-binding cassette domain-containing protein [Schleiferilactobacillus harbinensis]|uniref:ABC transporter, ATP-binding protein n=1 Tax=Schleiferilactobacillus harbinensis DSM 16991 TaxID=1122147 RepID=A0A0R1XAQ5_9LACO|nr:ABC transporter ATP-binding protein [Schleiferilactobacillus harbinensis]KRM27290.1 ABC transporter, ATP-binding protein [Schleiferilactobacillus harbinensis DSM 16991]QFR63188.1 ATP-binding cassette domain-containing protein [Schleiferilactobacillus harbinensis]
MLLTAKNLTKTYGDHVAVNGINLTIEKGSLTAVLGPNGAGKSTTINMLTGLLAPTAGMVSYADETKIGVVFQNSMLDKALTVTENLRIRAKQYRDVPASRVAVLIEELGLTDFQNQPYGTLSGGQRRRVDIARALLNAPTILFLDEPTTGLDIQTRTAIWSLLHALQQSQQLTILLTTHYLDEADHADMVYIVDRGQVIAQGTAATIRTQYAQNVLTVTTAAGEQVHHPQTAQAAMAFLTAHKQVILNFEYRAGTMDDAFMALTGKEMR